ncbi:MAG: alpha-amylase [Bacteroidetes bacterium]|nr:alpha-amylase [Bacteroidota bacterium]
MRNRLRFFVLILSLLSLTSQAFCQSAIPQRLNRQKTTDTKVYYSVFVQSFYDANGDGIGDLEGLISKLDYLQELGIGGIWLLPVHPSPTYHKYDVVDYKAIHPDYGNLNDYKQLVEEAHKRNMTVLLDFVVNHSSNQHPWFVSASQDRKSSFRDYYVWSDDEADFEKEPFHWHQIRNENGELQDGSRYYGFFWWEMPDLNLANRKLRKEVINIARFWLEDIGIDGFRLDAIKYIFPEDQLDNNLDWWSYFRKGINKSGKNPFVVAEIWGTSGEVAPYLGHGISAGFNFELSDSIKMSLQDGVNHNVAETVIRAYQKFGEENDSFEDAIFLTNHDMNRIMTEIKGNETLAKAAAVLLFTLPGNPFVYYGEEIGMLGEKPDEFIREPFLWDIEGEDEGQTHWEIPYASSSKTVKPLSFQRTDSRSVYNTYKKLIHLRNESPGLYQGGLIPLKTANDHVLAYFRTADLDHYLIIINLSEEIQEISSPASLSRYDMVFGSHPVFKGGEETIYLQPYSSFILKRHE